MSSFCRHRCRIIMARRLLLIVMTSALMAAMAGQASAESDGDIVIRSAGIRTELNSWLLDARADIQLTPAMQAGLDSGVPLTFIVDFDLRESRPYWADAPILGFKRRYQLIYYELTRHYRVQAVNRGASRNYRSLMSALDGLGSLTSLSIGRPTIMSLGTPQSDLLARLSIRFDGKALPLPLQPLFGSTWRLDDATHEWVVN